MSIEGGLRRCAFLNGVGSPIFNAAGDNRVGIIATLFLPVVGWVGFNIAGPALNQLANTGKNASRR